MRSTSFKFVLFIVSIIVISSCSEQKPKVTEADLLFSSLQTDQVKWWNYHKSNVDLTSDFIPLGEAGDTIPKKLFLEQLVTGKFIPIRLRSDRPEKQYRLFRLNEKADQAIEYTIASDAYREYKHYMMENREFPDFRLTDLDGNTYSKKELLGRTLVIKTWFLKCKPCIEEMPRLNALVEDYKGNDDVVFMSLSTDSEEELKVFLSEREFLYPVVADSKSFIENTLDFNIYPTHIIVDKQGKVKKVFNTAPEMIATLENLLNN